MNGSELRNARIESGLTQAQLGRMVDLKNWDISEIETGKRTLTPELSEKLEDALTAPRPRKRSGERGPQLHKSPGTVSDIEVARRIREGLAQLRHNYGLAKKRGMVVDLTYDGERVEADKLDIISIAKTF